MSHCGTRPGWWVYQCWQQGHSACFRVICLFQEDVHEHVLCTFVASQRTALELFKPLRKLNWSFCVGIYMDRVATVTGWFSGFTTQVKEAASECESVHCVTHGETVHSWKMSPELNVLHDVIKIINHIKVHILKSDLFVQLCEEMDTEHTCLPSYTEVTSVQLLSRVQLCNPMDCSTPGLPVHHQLPEFTQTHVHWVGDAIQSSHPLSSPSPPDLNPSQHQGLFKWVSSFTSGGQNTGVSVSTSVLPQKLR